MKNTDLLTHSEKNHQADQLCAEKSGYYEMMQFHSCLAVLKWKKPIPKDFPPQKTKQKFAKIFDRARKGTENDAQKCLQFPPFCVTLFYYVID